MKDKFNAELEHSRSMTSSVEKVIYLSSVLRSVLQTAAISSLEIATQLIPSASDDKVIAGFLDRLRQPSDGLPVEIIDYLTPPIRSFIDRAFCNGWFEPGVVGNPLIRDLTAWIEFRNKKPSHGVLDKNTSEVWSERLEELVARSLTVFSKIIPTLESGKATITTRFGEIALTIPPAHQGKAFVITKIQDKKGIWKIHGQQLSWTNSAEFVIDLPESNIFSLETSSLNEKFKLREITHNNKAFSIFQNIPPRQTSTFEGRSKELDRLKKWIGDADEPRVCLVYGDGGYGKTTLVLEFLNNFLEGMIETDKKPPEIISYHTAKMTRWTDQGITHFKGISNAMEDSIREIMYCFQDVLEKSWYKIEGIALIDKVKNELSEQGYDREDILIIVDNAETLAESNTDMEALSGFFELVSKKIGRLIVTSRRREIMAAAPIKVSSLNEADSIRLMRRLADEYGAQPIKQAGDARLRSVSSQLSHKPLLLDALVRYIARAGGGIDDALDGILRKSSDQLLEFLYEDAWARMGTEQKQVFMVIVNLTCPKDSFSIGIACQEIGIQHASFQEGLDETYFATITDHGSSYELELVDLAARFFAQKYYRLIDEEKELIRSCARNVDEQAFAKEKAEREYKNDRVAEAFRGHYAKAAKISSQKGNNKEAKEFFEIALQEDPVNSALHDRFAWFLLHRMSDPAAALPIALQAVELDSSNADALLTTALIYYHQKDLKNGDSYIVKANKSGKPAYLCTMRMGIARYHATKDMDDKKAIERYTYEAIEYLTRAERELTTKDRYYDKNRSTITKYFTLINKLKQSFNS